MVEYKAKLEVKKTKNGAKQITFYYEKKGKTKPRILTQTAEKEKVDFSLDGKDCVFETEGNKIVKLTVDDQAIFNIKGQGTVAPPPSRQRQGNPARRNAGNPVGPSKAPYNFIPLNTNCVPSEHETWEQIPGFDQYEKGTLSGTIEIEIKTKTPLYIRDTKTTAMHEGQQPESFFAPDGTPKIPGSSLKGLVRSMVEIASYSKFSFVDVDTDDPKNIQNHIPNKTKKILDMTEALFGDTEHISGRVSFEDANFTGDKNQAFEATTSPKILSSPKPTTFQHYLEQPQGTYTPKDQLNNWNDNAPIRGHKMYWHRNNPNWSEGKPIRDRNDTQHTIITPVKTGSTFKGTIRFENLTEVELGALLFVLELKENLCHKIGMAKPLGLGSIKIKPTLKLIDRHSEQGRYATLFSNSDWHTA
ncbi:MAG: TIGR03986 family CRISPR-associated RAMP protein, partial [Thermotogota bacterium]|nr:TIGR03986 family CRISPR-associated RAMP protein [Thermotogota bacterium]